MFDYDDDQPAGEPDGDEALLSEARDAFERAVDGEADNRREALDDLRFARLGEQWPEAIRKQRELDGKPCLTINRLPAFIRQVVNDARQNKPAITVHPVDSKADPETAEVMSDMIRHIEQSSDAEVAYDTALDFAVSGGLGYFRVNSRYADDDTFDQELCLEAVPDPFRVYGDPDAEPSADSSEWNQAFVASVIPCEAFEARYPDAEAVDWDGLGELGPTWKDGESVTLLEWWKREVSTRTIIQVGVPDDMGQPSDLEAVDLEVWKANAKWFAEIGARRYGPSRTVKTHKVVQRIMTGSAVLETVNWPGRYIPIVPVYGEDITIEGVRYLRGMIRDAKDSQRRLNYHTSTVTELVALAPKAPWVGRRGAFETDRAKWETANQDTHAYLEYDGPEAPQRQGFAGVPAGEMQQALMASDEMKAIMGLHDASLGAQSNETSGRAIMARQREGDVSTFNFVDNLSRALRHAGRILVDLMPHVYSGPRIARLIGADGKKRAVPINQPHMGQVKGPDGQMQAVRHFFDLTAGRYDVTVSAGPSFTSRREEAANQMVELIRSYPAAAPVLGDLLARNLDWPGADEVAERLQALLPPPVRQASGLPPLGGPGNLPPEVQQGIQKQQAAMQQLQQQSQQQAAQLQQAEQALQRLQADRQLEARKLEIENFQAQTQRLAALAKLQPPAPAPGASLLPAQPGQPGSGRFLPQQPRLQQPAPWAGW